MVLLVRLVTIVTNANTEKDIACARTDFERMAQRGDFLGWAMNGRLERFDIDRFLRGIAECGWRLHQEGGWDDDYVRREGGREGDVGEHVTGVLLPKIRGYGVFTVD